MLDNIRRFLYPVLFSLISWLLQYFSSDIFENQIDAANFLKNFSQMLIFVGLVFSLARFRIPQQNNLLVDLPIFIFIITGFFYVIYERQEMIIMLGVLYFLKDYIKLSQSKIKFNIFMFTVLSVSSCIVLWLNKDLLTRNPYVIAIIVISVTLMVTLCSFSSLHDIDTSLKFKSKKNFVYMFANELMPSLSVYLQQVGIFGIVSVNEYIEYRKELLFVTLAIFIGAQSQVLLSKYRIFNFKKLLHWVSIMVCLTAPLVILSPLLACVSISLFSTFLYCVGKVYLPRPSLLFVTFFSNTIFVLGFSVLYTQDYVSINYQYLLISLSQFSTFLIITKKLSKIN